MLKYWRNGFEYWIESSSFETIQTYSKSIDYMLKNLFVYDPISLILR